VKEFDDRLRPESRMSNRKMSVDRDHSVKMGIDAYALRLEGGKGEFQSCLV